MKGSPRGGILLCLFGGLVLCLLGIFLASSGPGGEGSLGGILVLLGAVAMIVGWVWTIVVCAMAERWGWLVAMIFIPGVVILYPLFGPMKPITTGPQGVITGSPQGGQPPAPQAMTTGLPVPGHTARWEYCEIDYAVPRGDSGYFYASAIGPHGRYSAAENRGRCKAENSNFLITGVTMEPSSRCQPLLDELIASLTGDGWEPTGGTGKNWWNYQFRRAVA